MSDIIEETTIWDSYMLKNHIPYKEKDNRAVRGPPHPPIQ